MSIGIDLERFGLLQAVVDEDNYKSSVSRFQEENILLPTFEELADPTKISDSVNEALKQIDPNEAHPLNLFRVHWYNEYEARGTVDVPQHIVLPSELTGVDAKIVLAFGNRFPMITAHKVLAAYSCFAPRVISGQFNPAHHRAIWPSTGNFARGGIAISTLMRSRGVAVLPENMSQERFDWLDKWVMNPDDIIRTPGSESNVKEIYDACNELEKDESNFIFNQFSEYANHIGHYAVTGRALGHVFETLKANQPQLNLAACTFASGSAGILAAGDRLKDDYGAKITAVEALECPTMLYNGYGEHNIQGIGDKHIPLIHNVMNTDIVAGISDAATDGLNLVFTTDSGKEYLKSEHQVPAEIVDNLRHLGFSSICNMMASIKTAKELNLGPNDVIMTVATDGSELYESEKAHLMSDKYPNGFTAKDAHEIFTTHVVNADSQHLEILNDVGRNRIFNLGYYTWVEQQGIPVEDFDARRSQEFWNELHKFPPIWDEMIRDFNAQTGVSA